MSVPVTKKDELRSSPPRERILVLHPSKGVGGGVEAYGQGVLDQLQAYPVDLEEMVLHDEKGVKRGLKRKVAFSLRALGAARRSKGRLRILCFQPALLPVGLLCRRMAGRDATLQVFCYGAEIWHRSLLWRLLITRSNIELVTISEFTAGALTSLKPPHILLPFLPKKLRGDLEAVASQRQVRVGSLRVLTVFRLGAFREKGGHVLVEAVQRLRESGEDIELVVAGKAEIDRRELDALFADRADWARLVRDPSQDELVELYRRADLFVLATRLRGGRSGYGEGFGIVLLEAATAGLPVIGPWGGGGHAAMIDGVTGLRPTDESAESLVELLQWAARHRPELALMGHNGRCWAAQTFGDSASRRRVGQVVLGRGSTDGIASNLELQAVR